MLVLSRKIGEVITVGNSVKITVLSFDRGVVRLGIEAPKTIPVHRKEVYDKIIEINKQASKTDVNALKNIISSQKVKLKPVKGAAQQPPSHDIDALITAEIVNKESE